MPLRVHGCTLATTVCTELYFFCQVASGRSLYNAAREQAVLLSEEFVAAHEYAWSSKAMHKIIQGKVEIESSS